MEFLENDLRPFEMFDDKPAIDYVEALLGKRQIAQISADPDIQTRIQNHVNRSIDAGNLTSNVFREVEREELARATTRVQYPVSGTENMLEPLFEE